MAKGSCQCGDFQYEITGKPTAQVACHCIPCRKTSGTTGSYNLIVPDEQFTVKKGISKQYTRKGDSGKDVVYNSCPICSTLLYVTAEAMAGSNIVKIGTVDDKAFLEEVGRPAMEIYAKNMCSWEKPWEGAEVKEVS